MKRFGAIASLLLVAAIGVGAFVYAGSDSGGGKKSSATVVKEEPNTSTATTAKQQSQPPQPVTSNSVASASPTPKPTSDDNVFHVGDDAKPELDGYEARKVFVGVDPSVATSGRKLELQVRGFQAFEQVKVTVTSPSGAVVGGALIQTDKRGRGKSNLIAPTLSTKGSTVFLVTAVGQTSGRAAGTALKVVLKK